MLATMKTLFPLPAFQALTFSEPEDYRLTETGCGFSLVRKSRAFTNPRRHFHPWWELMYIASGERTFFYENRTLHITAGTFLCIAPGILHRAVNPAGEVCKLYNVYFSDSDEPLPACDTRFAFLAPVLTQAEPCLVLLPEAQEAVSALFSRLGREMHLKKSGWKNMAWALLSEILVTATRSENAARLSPQAAASMPASIAAVIDYLNTHYAEPLSLSLVSAHFGMSESHLSRSFKAATHFSFVEYINSLRITKACRLLAAEKTAVLEIAMRCGFGSVTQFGRTFRALTGTSPHRYRTQRQESTH